MRNWNLSVTRLSVYNGNLSVTRLSVKYGNMSETRLSLKCGNLSVRKRFIPDKLYFELTLSVRRRGTTDKICPIGKLLSGLTFHLSVLMRVVVSVSAVTS